MNINIDYDKCNPIDCLDCLDICPMDVFTFKDNVLIINKLNNCCGCRVCIDVCVYNALTINY